MQKIIRSIRKIRDFCSITTPDYFIKEQHKVYFVQDVLKSLEQVTSGLKFSSQKSLKSIIHHLHCILFYICNSQVYDKEVQQFIEHNELALITSTIEVLKFYKEYLKKIVPTNATYFHFLRDSQFYMHYTVVRYVLIVGDSQNIRKISKTSLYSKIPSDLKRSIFSYLVQWLSDLVDYRNSAVYVKNTSIQYLISNTYILTCGLLGRSYQNTISLLDKSQRKDMFNKVMFVSIYILCDTVNNNKKQKYFLVSLSISCLRKMLIESDIPTIDIFIPSYLYVDMIGFIHCPLTYEIVLRILVFFLNEGYQREQRQKIKQKENNGRSNSSAISENNSVQTYNQIFVSPLTEANIWAVIHLIIQKYGTYNKAVIESFLTKIISSIRPQSIARAYCIKIIQQLDLDLGNEVIKSFYLRGKYAYCIENKILSIELVIMNFLTFMEAIYSNYVQEAVLQKQVVLSPQNIFKYLLEFNKEEIEQVENLRGDKRKARKSSSSSEGNVQQSSKLTDSVILQGTDQNEHFQGIQGLGVDENKKQEEIDPHIKQSTFYENRHKSQLYQKNSPEKSNQQNFMEQGQVEQ